MSDNQNYNPGYLVVSKDKKVKIPTFFMKMAAIVFCYSGVPVFLLADIYVTIFQKTYFRMSGIPQLDRSDFIQIDRHKLPKLSLAQKVNCVYCGYANGVAAYFKAVVNHMEVHSCAIKHILNTPATEHQKDFYERSKFE